MTNPSHEFAVKRSIEHVESVCRLLLARVASVGDLGREKLYGAYTYQYAAMLADFVKDAEKPDWIGPAVNMHDGSLKPMRDFLMDHLFDTLFLQIAKQGGEDFLLQIRYKAQRILGTANVTDQSQDTTPEAK